MRNRSTLLGAVLTSEQSDRVTSVARAYYRDQKRELRGLDFSHQQGAVPVFVRSRSENLTRDWRVDYGISAEFDESHIVSIGADFFRNDYDFKPVSDRATGMPLPMSSGSEGDLHNAGLYMQDEIRLSKKVQLISGIRVDSHSEFDEAVSPKAGVLCSLGPDTVVRSSVGRAYRAPSAVELFQPTILFGSTTFESNPDLDPEYIITADIGLEQKLAGNARQRLVELGMKQDQINDLEQSGDARSRLTIYSPVSSPLKKATD